MARILFGKKNPQVEQTKGFVFVTVEPGRDREFLESIRSHDFVDEAHIVTGEYNVFLMLKAPTMESIHEFVLHEVRYHRDVRSSNTFFATATNLA